MGGGIRRRAEQRRGQRVRASSMPSTLARRWALSARTAPVRSRPATTVGRLIAMRRTGRTRVTLRCVREDLELGAPPIEVDLGALDRPLVAEARRVAPAAPRGRSGSSRSSTRSFTGSVTAAGAARRGSRPTRAASGSAPARRGRPGPPRTPTSISSLSTSPAGSYPMTTTASATRSNATLASSTPRRPSSRGARRCARAARPRCRARVRRARRRSPARDRCRRRNLGRIATQAADGRFADERLRGVLFRLVVDAAGAELWEPRAD
jgi:hypothetical protein